MPRYAARVDGNQAEIVAALRKVGASVEPLHTVGHGVTDLLVGYQGGNYLIEIKDPAQPISGQQLTKDQKAWHANWRGQVGIAKTAEEAIAIICG